MARTAEGRLLTIRHRQTQVALRARMLRDFAQIWPVWTGDEQTFRLLVSATIPLVGAHRGTSGTLATSYYELFRQTERVGGAATPKPGNPLDRKAVETSLYVTGMNSVKKSLGSGFSVQAAKQNAFVRVSGAMTRHVLNGGRDSLIKSTASDPKAGGWARVTGDPCSFCAMLASRGAVFSEDTVDFQAHDHCVCGGEPQYEGSELPGDAERYREIWNDTIKPERYWNERRGGYRFRNPPDALNQFRQALAAKAE